MIIVGQKYGRLTILADTGKRTRDRKRIFLCKCDCGNIVEVRGGGIGKKTNSCGCLYKESRKNGKLKGDMPRLLQSLYTIWRGMRNRCYQKSQINYERYGGAGITVCNEWKDDYEAFRVWAIENGFVDKKGVPRSERMSIDRIDPTAIMNHPTAAGLLCLRILYQGG